MARFGVGGDNDGNEDQPTNKPSPKRPRLRTSIVSKLPAAAASKSPDRPTIATDPESKLARTSVPEERAPKGDKWGKRPEERVPKSGKWDKWSCSPPRNEECEDEQQQQTEGSDDEIHLAEAWANQINVNRGIGSDAGRESEGTSKSVSVTLSDPDALDCPICFKSLCSPVYQCEDGHIACASCCTRINNKCATCCRPTGFIRCRALENVLESVRVACPNMPYGCKETFSYSKKLAHEKTCTFTSCSCPLSACGFVGISKSLHAHFAQIHSKYSMKFHFNEVISISLYEMRKYVYLQETKLNTLFILNHSVETVGSLVNVVCVGPISENGAFSYDLTVTDGENLVKLRSSMSNMPKWMAQPPENIYLVVPSHFISSSGHLKVQLIIQRNF